MASLDAARAASQAPHAWDGPLAAAAAAVEAVRWTEGVHLLADSVPAGAAAGVAAWDPLRLTLCCDGASGRDLAVALEARGVVAELATEAVVVLALGAGSTADHAGALATALAGAAADARAAGGGGQVAGGGALAPLPIRPRTTLPFPATALPPRAAFEAATEAVPLAAAAGRVAGELVTPYPPGIPALLPGEVVTPAILHALAAVVEGDGEVVGPEDGSLATLRVVVE